MNNIIINNNNNNKYKYNNRGKKLMFPNIKKSQKVSSSFTH
jgi:hypothetical protein